LGGVFGPRPFPCKRGPSGAQGTERAHWFRWGTDVPWASRAGSSVKASSIALRLRVSLDGSRCVYVRSVKPLSECPRYSESPLMLSPASRSTEAYACRRAPGPPGGTSRRAHAAGSPGGGQGALPVPHVEDAAVVGPPLPVDEEETEGLRLAVRLAPRQGDLDRWESFM
jgi:hypothetical protein